VDVLLYKDRGLSASSPSRNIQPLLRRGSLWVMGSRLNTSCVRLGIRRLLLLWTVVVGTSQLTFFADRHDHVQRRTESRPRSAKTFSFLKLCLSSIVDNVHLVMRMEDVSCRIELWGLSSVPL